MIKTTYILIIIFLFSCNNSPNRKINNDSGTITVKSIESLTTELNEIYNQGHINGFSVAIVNEDKTIYQKGFGLADLKTKRKYTIIQLNTNYYRL